MHACSSTDSSSSGSYALRVYLEAVEGVELEVLQRDLRGGGAVWAMEKG